MMDKNPETSVRTRDRHRLTRVKLTLIVLSGELNWNDFVLQELNKAEIINRPITANKLFFIYL